MIYIGFTNFTSVMILGSKNVKSSAVPPAVLFELSIVKFSFLFIIVYTLSTTDILL
jgi:hypothetical protein